MNFPKHLCGTLLTGWLCLATASGLFAQSDTEPGLGGIQLPEDRLPLCFGFSDIRNPRALEVCDALNLNENVRARELSEQWVREQPGNPAAQFALAEVLFTVEGNLPRALYHLNLAEQLTGYESLEEALDSGNLQWHYLTLSQLSYVHQLMGNQRESLNYLDKIEEIYGQDVESFRGWPLIKLKDYDAARASANKVLEESDDRLARSRAWNTLCAVELASLQAEASMNACERSINEDEAIANDRGSVDTVYLTNASEVALSLLRMDEAEQYIDRATRYLNPDSVADPWVYKLYLLMSQGRFDEARQALDRMLVWRDQQEPVVNVMNRAEHFMVSAGFLLLAGYIEDAVKLSGTALNQPDRNGSYSADDAQKDAYAALMNTVALRTAYQQQLEMAATESLGARLSARLKAQATRLDAWRTGRRAAALFANFDVLQSRVRPYAPLDVHIPEWLEPEIVNLVGTGVLANTLDQARANGVFRLNEGYYHAYRAEIAALNGNAATTLEAGEQALTQLPQPEILLRARVTMRMAGAAWSVRERQIALELYARAWQLDPGLARRLGVAIPVNISTDGSGMASDMAAMLRRSPRFSASPDGLPMRIGGGANPEVCLNNAAGESMSCYNLANSTIESGEEGEQIAAQLVQQFHETTFGLGYDISKAQRSRLLGSSVILNGQTSSNLQNSRDAFLGR